MFIVPFSPSKVRDFCCCTEKCNQVKKKSTVMVLFKLRKLTFRGGWKSKTDYICFYSKYTHATLSYSCSMKFSKFGLYVTRNITEHCDSFYCSMLL